MLMLAFLTASYITGGAALAMIGIAFAILVALPAAVGVVASLAYVAVRRTFRVRCAVLVGASTGVMLSVCNYVLIWWKWHPLPFTYPLSAYLVLVILVSVGLCAIAHRLTAVLTPEPNQQYDERGTETHG